MQIGMVGLGRMGANMVHRLLNAGHECVVHDVSEEAVRRVAAEGARGTGSLEELVAALAPPRAVWLMLPAAVTGGTVARLMDLLSPGDAVIDGGNCSYRDDIDRAEAAAGRGLRLRRLRHERRRLGPRARLLPDDRRPSEAVARLEPVFAALAPGVEAAPRTPGRTGDPAPAEQGWLHCGPAGAGHFVKMVHNGIEYALMAAYAEGLNVLIRGAGRGGHPRADAETAPLRDPEYYPYEHRPRRGRRGVAARQRRRVVAARPHRRGAARRLRHSSSSPAGCPTPGRAGGRRSPRSRRAYPRRCSRPRSTAASRPAAARSSPTRSSPRSASSSAGTSRRRPHRVDPTATPRALNRSAAAEHREPGRAGVGAQRLGSAIGAMLETEGPLSPHRDDVEQREESPTLAPAAPSAAAALASTSTRHSNSPSSWRLCAVSRCSCSPAPRRRSGGDRSSSRSSWVRWRRGSSSRRWADVPVRTSTRRAR